MAEPDGLTREERLALYKIAVEESRFQVLLNWDRAKHHLVFNTAILAAAAGLMKLDVSLSSNLLAMTLFLIGTVNSAAGVHVVKVGHGYYREARAKVALHEKGLGLMTPTEGNAETLAIASTPGQREELTGAKWPRPPLGNITAQIRATLGAMAVLNFVGLLYVVARVAR